MEICVKRWQCHFMVSWCWAGCVSDNEEECEDVGKGKKRGSKRRKVSLLEEKNNRFEKLVSTLREKFSTIQYRLWAEMIDVGTHRYISLYMIVKTWNLYIHNYCLFKLWFFYAFFRALFFFRSSLDNPPSIPVFTGKEQRRSPMSDLSIAVAQMAKAVTSSHSLGTTSCQTGGISPI